jgi:hypothetical protein
MKTAMPVTQRGLSFVGFIFGALILVLVAIIGLRLIPAYMQNAEVQKIFVTIANDPEMQKANTIDIRMSFNKRASIDNINAIKSDDIKIFKVNGKLVLSADYVVKISLAGNVSLNLEFQPTSAE